MTYDKFDFDIRRTALLNAYIAEWGEPGDRRVIRKDGDPPIEVYLFVDDKVVRYVTIGLSAQLPQKSYRFEILFASGHNMAGSSLGHLMDYICDIAASAVKYPHMLKAPTPIGPSPLAPKSWKMNCLLVDAARGEPERFENIAVSGGSVKLLWLIPLYENEYDFIKSHGVEAFDALCDVQDLSVIDLNRKSFVPTVLSHSSSV